MLRSKVSPWLRSKYVSIKIDSIIAVRSTGNKTCEVLLEGGHRLNINVGLDYVNQVLGIETEEIHHE